MLDRSFGGVTSARWRAEDYPLLSLISEGAPRRARSPATPEIFLSFKPLRRGSPMESDDGADGEGVTAASGGATRRASKRNDAQGGSAPPARIVTQPGNPTQADDFVPPQLECGASKLDETCPELMEHLRPCRHPRSALQTSPNSS